MLGLYFPQTDLPLVPIGDHASMATIVADFAARLSGLPTSAVS
jgi:hypothetical protein